MEFSLKKINGINLLDNCLILILEIASYVLNTMEKMGWLMGLEPTTTGITILTKCHLLVLIAISQTYYFTIKSIT